MAKELKHTNWEAVAERAKKCEEAIKQMPKVTWAEAKEQCDRLREMVDKLRN